MTITTIGQAFAMIGIAAWIIAAIGVARQIFHKTTPERGPSPPPKSRPGVVRSNKT